MSVSNLLNFKNRRYRGIPSFVIHFSNLLQNIVPSKSVKKVSVFFRQEQVSVLYQNIHIVEPRLIQSYEHVIKNFIREIKLQSTEMETLAIAVKRYSASSSLTLLHFSLSHFVGLNYWKSLPKYA